MCVQERKRRAEGVQQRHELDGGLQILVICDRNYGRMTIRTNSSRDSINVVLPGKARKKKTRRTNSLTGLCSRVPNLWLCYLRNRKDGGVRISRLTVREREFFLYRGGYRGADLRDKELPAAPIQKSRIGPNGTKGWEPIGSHCCPALAPRERLERTDAATASSRVT